MYFNEDSKDVAKQLETSLSNGLTNNEAASRLAKDGYNQLKEQKQTSIFSMFISQFKDFLILILLGASIISAALGEGKDAIVILVIVFVNAIISTIQEAKAQKALNSLKALSAPNAKVVREGKSIVVPSKEVVVGDIVLLEAGDFIPADGRIFESASLKVQESSLTGESVPVEKIHSALDVNEVALGDRVNMVYSSGMVTYGRGKVIITGTGMSTEIGKIAGMLDEADSGSTPLQERINEVGKVLGFGCLFICALIFAIGFFYGKDPFVMFMTSVSLAVAAIPEGLPAVITIVLAMGVSRLSKKRAIVRKMNAVETLGSASVICSDKTGTLTMNKMTVERAYTANKIIFQEHFGTTKDENFKLLAEIAYDCSDAQITKSDDGKDIEVGDPTEVALIYLARESNITRNKTKRSGEIPFDSDRKLMSTVHKTKDGYILYTKGAPDILMNRCTSYLDDEGNVKEINKKALDMFIDANEEFSSQAYRVLAYGYRIYKEQPDLTDFAKVESDLTLVGLTAMMDPPREEVIDAIRVCKKAGIRAVMITGDHITTAKAIAKQIGILTEGTSAILGSDIDKMSDEEFNNNIEKYSVYARVSPEHKVKIVKAWQNDGKIVAMTGDGVNDAPALKQANIGCAMGITGTDVSKDAADMVLTDDNFATIVSAVEEGRSIFSNIRKSIHFLLSCNVGEVVTLFIATLLNWASPLLPIHILWVNLVTDSLPALALGADPKEKGIMKQAPKDPNEGIFANGLGVLIVLQGALIGCVTLAAFWYGQLFYNLAEARTMAFLVLCLSQLFHTFNVRATRESIFNDNPFKNKYLIIANIVSMLLATMVVIIPSLRTIFELAPLKIAEWDVVVILSIIPVIVSEIYKFIYRLIKKEENA